MHIAQQTLDEYRRNGIVKIEQLISREEAVHYRTATLALLQSTPTGGSARYGEVFHQYVDTWRDDETLRTIRFDAPLNAFLVRALDAGARLGSWCGDESFSGHCRSAARRVRRVFHDAFWDPDAGLYQMTRGTKAAAPASE